MTALMHRSAARIAVTLSAAVLGAYGLAASPAAAAPAAPDGGNGFTVSLAPISSYPYAGQSVTLTATASADVGPTPYYITIYSETTGAELAVCGADTTCAATVSQNTAGSQAFEAFVGDDVPAGGHPGFVLVASNQADVTWWRFILRGGDSELARPY